MWSGSRGAADGGLGLVMDYAAGGSLAQLVNCRGPLGVGEAVTVLTPIAQALGYLHGKGFMHSDVAPGNVLFTAHGKPLLADLGITRMVGDAAATFPAGTDGFLDPAPVDALRAGLQPERDVYSAAAVGWYCLTGKAPERGPKPSAAVPCGPGCACRPGRRVGGGPAARTGGSGLRPWNSRLPSIAARTRPRWTLPGRSTPQCCPSC